ncbi:MAG TPA: hypothetical protein VKK79_15595, partial [Candidatus Lokiarchaeia archaeon]|nr:hypothetical protein [Candidatus Lokiarchaeia archaeon]
LSEKIEEKREMEQEELQKILRNLFKRKTILESQYEFLKLQLAEFARSPEGKRDEPINIDPIVSLRTMIFEFETDLNKAYVNHLEFKPLFNNLSKSWQELKKNVLNLLERQNDAVKLYYRKAKEVQDPNASFREDYTFEVILQELLELVSESIRVYLDSVENLEENFKPVYNLIEFGDFARAREVLNLRIADRFRDIDQRNRQIEKLMEDLDLLFPEYDRAKNVRTYVENWQYIRDEVVKRIKNYQKNSLEKILTKEISGLLQMANPLKLSKIANYVQMPEAELQEILMGILDKKLIFAHIQGGSLKAHSRLTRPDRIFSIRKQYEMVGNRLKLIVRILNTSSFVIRDVSILLKLPCMLELSDSKTSENYLNLGDFEPNATKKLEWVLRVSADPMKRRMKLGSVKLMINFTDFQNQPKSKVKVFDLLVY